MVPTGPVCRSSSTWAEPEGFCLALVGFFKEKRKIKEKIFGGVTEGLFLSLLGFLRTNILLDQTQGNLDLAEFRRFFKHSKKLRHINHRNHDLVCPEGFLNTQRSDYVTTKSKHFL